MLPLICIAGPTASGKTSLAIKLAEHFNAEILSFDSRQFYSELNIGTAKPDADLLMRVPHHFINCGSIHEPISAGAFSRAARKCIATLQAQQKTIIAVGGSGLYLKALLYGLDEMATVDPTIRQELIQQYSQFGIQYLQTELAKADPVYWKQVDKHNPQRLMRALEIIRGTGKPYSHFLQQTAPAPFTPALLLGIELSREKLYVQINARVDHMIKAGLLDEVRALLPFQHLGPLKTVGYRELFLYLQNQCSLNQAIEAIKQHTRHYAKRQITWFKNQMPLNYFKTDDLNAILNYINQNAV